MAANTASRPISATVLLGLGLTPGKLRGLQRISNPNGTLTMVAFDQNSSMIGLAQKAKGREPTYDEVVDAKLDLMRQMSPVASGTLIDGYYGAWPAIATGAMPPDKGLIVRIEKSGAKKNDAGGTLGEIEAGMSVEKLKLMGVDVVKLLAQFEPTELASADHQFSLVSKIYEDCKKYDILMLLEPTAFEMGGEKKTDASFLDRKAETVIESAKHLSRLCDVYKAEFPGTLGHESEDQLKANLHALNAASARPWVLLSAGVDYDDYVIQVKMAMQSGASGILGGRAFWKEYFQQPDAAARTRFAGEVGAKRIKEIDKIVQTGTPWFARYGLTKEAMAQIRAPEGWHYNYATSAESAGGVASKYKAGEIY